MGEQVINIPDQYKEQPDEQPVLEQYGQDLQEYYQTTGKKTKVGELYEGIEGREQTIMELLEQAGVSRDMLSPARLKRTRELIATPQEIAEDTEAFNKRLEALPPELREDMRLKLLAIETEITSYQNILEQIKKTDWDSFSPQYQNLYHEYTKITAQMNTLYAVANKLLHPKTERT